MVQNDPKISTGQEKIAPTCWHGWHVFATLVGWSDKAEQYSVSIAFILFPSPVPSEQKDTIKEGFKRSAI